MRFAFKKCLRLSFLLLLVFSFDKLAAKPANGAKNKSGGRFSVGTFSFKSSYFQTDLAPLNRYVTESFGLDKLDENMLMWGLGFNGYVDSRLSVGVQYVKGGCESEGIVTFNNIEEGGSELNLSRKVDYSLWYTGITLNYIVSDYGGYELFAGGNINYGKLNLTLSQDAGDQTFGDLWESYQPDTDMSNFNRATSFSTDIYTAEANLGLRYYLKEGIALSFVTGYNYGITYGGGSINSGFESIQNVPDLDFKGINYAVVLSIGN